MYRFDLLCCFFVGTLKDYNIFIFFLRNKWLTSSWSKCLSVNGGLQCTTGMQHRKAICVEENGKNNRNIEDTCPINSLKRERNVIGISV